MDEVNSCPDCNAHWIKLPNGIKIVLPNHRLPRIERDGNNKYLDREELVLILADHFKIVDTDI